VNGLPFAAMTSSDFIGLGFLAHAERRRQRIDQQRKTPCKRQ